jgi:hypothetical protein
MLGDGASPVDEVVGEVGDLLDPLRGDLVRLAPRLVQVLLRPLLGILAYAGGGALGGVEHALHAIADLSARFPGRPGVLALGRLVASSPDHQ